MKSINYSVIRSISALIIGLVMVIWPGSVANYLVITIGVLFIIPGLIGLIGYFTAGNNEVKPHFPIEALGSFLFGLWLVVFPDSVVTLLMYILGAILLLGGLHQIYSLSRARKVVPVPYGFFITPVLILLASILILASPNESQQTAFIIIGVTAMVYAGTELLNYFRFGNRKPKTFAGDIVEAEILED
ncbi:DUF308 domain-containing protein [Bacteroides sp. OttesenSCG-928-D19]|nr:DUF308 domain-containing protein [Bacteroides sp. OttesenSCG-928-D19]